jgi:hypothetical protein
MAGEITTNRTNETQPEINLQVVSGGFGSYLEGILPPNIAAAAGAFGASVSQIRNITNVPVEKLAQAAMTIETTKGLNINGSDIPAILSEADQALTLIALGSGPRGQYTTSDFFGCMSGLPYPLREIYNGIRNIQTQRLHNIYNQLFLAVTWEKARIDIRQPYWYVISKAYVPPTPAANPPNPNYNPTPPDPEPDPDPPYDDAQYTFAPTNSPIYWSHPGSPEEYDWYYSIVLSLGEDGGGYGRGTAPNPAVTISPNNVNASVIARPGRDDQLAASMGGGSFGRVSADINNGGSYLWAHTIQTNWSAGNIYPNETRPFYPPQDDGWVRSNMPRESVTIQHPPIETLPVSASGDISTLGKNTGGDVYVDPFFTGGSGKIASGEPGWSWMNSPVQSYITQANGEILDIRTNRPRESFLLNKLWDRTGEQLTREQRARSIGLSPLPVPKDDFLNRFPTTQIVFTDAVPQFALNTKPHMTAQTLEAIVNLCTSGGQSLVGMMRESRNQNKLTAIGIPLDNNISDTITAKENKQLIANGLLPGTIPAKLEQVRCDDGAILAPSPIGYYDPNTNLYIVTNPGIQPVIDDDGDSILPPQDPDTVDPDFPVFPPVIPDEPGPGTPIDTGEPDFPGSFGGGGFENIIPTELNPPYFSNNVLSSVYSINEAIDDVIRCNCDCWDEL